ncbi:unnamed protein product, partial [Mesorhabditis spiculigera]
MLVLITILAFFAGISAKTCPNGTVDASEIEQCLHFVMDTYAPFDQEGVCIGLGGGLVSIHSLFENQIMTAKAQAVKKDSVYIIGLWHNQVAHQNDWEWFDGSQYNYGKWAPGEPTYKCVGLNSGTGNWTSLPCTLPAYAICRLPHIQ